jgi:leader peptidase (prepilin peptidase)/N-methyltransferase
VPDPAPSRPPSTKLEPATGSAIVLPVAVGALAIAAGVASIAAAPGLRGVLAAGLAFVMLAVAVIDGRRFIIPNGLVAAGFGLGLIHAGIDDPESVISAVALAAFRGAVLAAVFLAIRTGYRRVRGRDGIGLGDVKLAAVAGVWLDWQAIALAVEIAALAALATYALRQWVLGRPMRRMGRLPLGLFLAPAIWLCWLLDATLFTPH